MRKLPKLPNSYFHPCFGNKGRSRFQNRRESSLTHPRNHCPRLGKAVLGEEGKPIKKGCVWGNPLEMFWLPLNSYFFIILLAY